jgi:FAD binding domain.
MQPVRHPTKAAEIVYELQRVKLEQTGGKVTGLIAKPGDAHYIRIKAAKGVALCCGGYAADKQMLATLNPDAYQKHRWFGCICTGHRRRHPCCYVGGC